MSLESTPLRAVDGAGEPDLEQVAWLWLGRLQDTSDPAQREAFHAWLHGAPNMPTLIAVPRRSGA